MEPISRAPQDLAIDTGLLAAAGQALQPWKRLYWVIGGAGSGKTTVCRYLAGQTGLPLYDMDARIYGDYHARFKQKRHPVNSAWSNAENGLAWLMARSWESFLGFSRAALAEYLDLLADDLEQRNPAEGLLIDGGIFTPGPAARILPANRMVCIAAPWLSGTGLWEGSEERRQMKAAFGSFPDPDKAWRRFLEFDHRINLHLLKECADCGIPILIREKSTTVPELAERILDVWKTE